MGEIALGQIKLLLASVLRRPRPLLFRAPRITDIGSRADGFLEGAAHDYWRMMTVPTL
jgi:hypothetical protein